MGGKLTGRTRYRSGWGFFRQRVILQVEVAYPGRTDPHDLRTGPDYVGWRDAYPEDVFFDPGEVPSGRWERGEQRKFTE